jgi:hypothetical protein
MSFKNKKEILFQAAISLAIKQIKFKTYYYFRKNLPHILQLLAPKSTFYPIFLIKKLKIFNYYIEHQKVDSQFKILLPIALRSPIP